MIEVLPLEPDPRSSDMRRQPLRLLQLTWPVHVHELAFPFLLERLICLRGFIRGRELRESAVEDLGNEATAPGAETSGGGRVGKGGFDGLDLVCVG
jgi:hypothetical protein